MNYKLLFPTYRNRYLFVRNNLKQRIGEQQLEKVLNLGTGEGDYDPMIAPYCVDLVACDINERDIAFAKQLNSGIENVEYQIEDALNLSFPKNSFDLIISIDVMEHVGKPERMVEEISRVLKPGGMAFITFPSLEFPATYDPINRFLSFFTTSKIPQGAYAFGHEYLIAGEEFKKWAQKNQLEILEERGLSGYLVGLLEMYWTGIIQRLFKANATNISDQKEKKISFRPSLKEPFLTKVTDTLIHLDYFLFNRFKPSIGKGFIIKKNLDQE